MGTEPVVFLIAGDSKVRRRLSARLADLGHECRPCHSPEHFQQSSSPHDAGCILFYLAHANLDLGWLATLGPWEHHWPVIGIAAEADVDAAVLAMKRGAFDFLLEACSDQRSADRRRRGIRAGRGPAAAHRPRAVDPPPTGGTRAAAPRRARNWCSRGCRTARSPRNCAWPSARSKPAGRRSCRRCRPTRWRHSCGRRSWPVAWGRRDPLGKPDRAAVHRVPCPPRNRGPRPHPPKGSPIDRRRARRENVRGRQGRL